MRWAFRQLPFPNQTSIWATLPESYGYASLDADVTDADFTGILIGDISGNWQPADGAAKALEKSPGLRR